MKTLVALLILFVLAGSVQAEPSNGTARAVDMRASVDAGAVYLDDVLQGTLASLRETAATPEAAAGEWQGIKPFLQRLKAQRPGVYFYVRPDGDYYSVSKDFTNLNLSNRPYFKWLFSGRPVAGFPIYSRSTGKKSAVLAWPVASNGKVTGALGVSVYLDDLSTALGHTLDLPEGYTWFVLDSKGNTMLDSDSDYIFMNALTQGGVSLHNGVAQALRHDSGTIGYTLENRRQGYYQKLPHTDWRLFVVRHEGHETPPPPKLTLSLERFVPALQHKLDAIDGSMTALIAKSGIDAPKERALRGLLRSIYDSNPDLINVGFTETNGTLRYLEPRDYRHFENSDIGTQEQVIAMKQNPAPLASKAFMAVEGFWAVTIDHPLFDRHKRFIGTVTALMRPELFIDALLKASTIPGDYELWIMQPDGRIVYDQDKKEIGRMLFSDPMYEGYNSLLELGRKIAASPAGEGNYIFLSPGLGEKVIKKAVWRTVRLHNLQWRVVLAYRPYEQ